MKDEQYSYTIQVDNPYGEPQPGKGFPNNFKTKKEAQQMIDQILKRFDTLYIPKTKDGSMSFGNKTLEKLEEEREFIANNWKVVKK